MNVSLVNLYKNLIQIIQNNILFLCSLIMLMTFISSSKMLFISPVQTLIYSLFVEIPLNGIIVIVGTYMMVSSKQLCTFHKDNISFLFHNIKSSYFRCIVTLFYISLIFVLPILLLTATSFIVGFISAMFKMDLYFIVYIINTVLIIFCIYLIIRLVFTGYYLIIQKQRPKQALRNSAILSRNELYTTLLVVGIQLFFIFIVNQIIISLADSFQNMYVANLLIMIITHTSILLSMLPVALIYEEQHSRM